MAEKKDLYVVVCLQGDVFPPLDLFKQSAFPFQRRICVHDVNPILIEWPVQGPSADFEEVLRCIAGQKEKIKTLYITQPFPGDREANINFFRRALIQLKEVANLKLLLRQSDDIELKKDLILLKQEFQDRKFGVSTVKNNKLSMIALSTAPPPQPADLNLSRSSDGHRPDLEEHKAMLSDYRSSHSIELSDWVHTLPAMSPQMHPQYEESKQSLPVSAVSSASNPAFTSLPIVNPSSSPPLPSPSKPESHGLMDFHEEDYRCIICLSIFRDPFITSCCNTIICQHCSSHLGSRCPQCRQQSFKLTTNLALNRIFEGIKEKCACGGEVSGRDWEEHKKICPSRTFKCPCGLSFCKADLIAHLKSAHREIMLSRLVRLKIA